jgi:hypothetical protein
LNAKRPQELSASRGPSPRKAIRPCVVQERFHASWLAMQPPRRDV